ncbi:MAG: DUF1015 domain-containing protein, partial [Armatimonadetes bacterium]|nr:DUF1015 domain-containing protein [Armatimonadota bacterium]
RANASAVFALYPDESNGVPALFRAGGLGSPLAQTVDSDGIVHRLFACTDSDTLRRVSRELADKPLFIADGHHRYETALAYRKELQAAGESIGPDHPASSVLAMCVSMHHPGLAVLPTHRILSDLPDLSTERLRQATAQHFEWTELMGAEATSPRLSLHLHQAEGHVFGLWTRDTTKAFLLKLKDPKVMDRLAADHSQAWRRLDVAVLQKVILEHDLPKAVAAADKMRLSYVHLAQQAFDAVHEEGADAAFVVRPLQVTSLQEIAAAGERMPPKSTYFYPKVLSGLVLNPLD